MELPDLIDEAFKYINAFKRARALAGIEKEKGNIDAMAHRKLEQYELIDKLELSLRAMQKEIKAPKMPKGRN